MTDTSQPVDIALDEHVENLLRDDIAGLQEKLLSVSHDIHRNPEVRFTEHHACALLADTLAAEGFTVETGIAGLPTAFLAEFGSADTGPTVAIFLEYDALEEIGHACGHNVIATIGLGAAIAVRRWLAASGAGGRIIAVGSPAEEGGGGKTYLLDSGLLDGIDAAMMMHPSGENLAAMRTLGRVALDFEFTGKAAHAAVSPHDGVNALDAAVLTLNAIGLLRQQLPDDVRVHAVIRDGGEVPNVIPERAVIRTYIRAADTEALVGNFQPRIERCAQGAALATGATVNITKQAPTYAGLRPNPVLAQLVDANFARIGRVTEPPRTEVFPGSTDMGNVSQLIPSIHPNIEFVPGLSMHTREAAAYAGGPEGDRAVTDGALVLAMTAAQLLARPELVEQVRAEFVEGTRVS